ncbi:hypothetical protein [Burkholderia gladioli]|uniref:hypothetical protein n=1 Tax=Burkholderia gladioli TaxID=28095 RepID=UPI001ABB4DD8|nr:hypothetical protein [Burkholderia gladioli]
MDNDKCISTPTPADERAARDDGFFAGVCVALQVLTTHDKGVIWKDIVQACGVDELLQYAANVEPEEWELAGFKHFASGELGRRRPAARRINRASQATAVADPFPYQKTFNAIAAATSIVGGHVSISVKAFQDAFGAAPADAREPSPTAGMNLGERIKHVGGRENAAGYIEFGSVAAVDALIKQVIRDLPRPSPSDAIDTALLREALDDQCAFQAEIDRLRKIINTPQSGNFLRAVSIEAEHQRQRWSSEHDGGKTPADWFWLVGYLAGKALTAANAGNVEKAEHHVITTAAALANWHLAIFGQTDMRPGIEPPAGQGVQGGKGGEA